MKIWVDDNLDITIYPSIVYDNLEIKLPVSSSTFKLQIVNSTGQIVTQASTALQTHSFSLKSLSKGVYFIKVFTNRQAITQKFIKF